MAGPQITWDDEQKTASAPARQVKWDDEAPAKKEEPGFLDREIPLTSHGAAWLSGLQSIGRGTRDAVVGMGHAIAHPIDTASSLIPTPESFEDFKKTPAGQVPAAIHDINESADPLGTYAKVGQETAGQGAGQALTALATEGLIKGANAGARGLGDHLSGPNVAAKAKATGSVLGREAVSRVPVLGRVVRRPSIGDYFDAIRAKAPAARVPEPLPPPDVYSPGYRAPRAYYGGIPPEPVPPRPGLELKGHVQGPFDGTYVDAPPSAPHEPPFAPAEEVLPQRELGGRTLGQKSLPERGTPIALPESSPARPTPREPIIRTTPSEPLPPLRTREAPPPPAPPSRAELGRRIGSGLNEALDAEKAPQLKRDVPLREQLGRKTIDAPAAGEHIPVKSSALQSYHYNPENQEFSVTTHDGTTHVYGEVTPEQVKEFEAADSKGKAWKNIRDNSTPVAKIVGGKRLPRIPTQFRSASPDDLTPDLEESLRQAKAKQAKKAKP